MKYGAFIGIIGGLASFIGPNYHVLIKAMIGDIIGCLLLGKRLPAALREMYDAKQAVLDEIEACLKKNDTDTLILRKSPWRF
jgi:hypothetical protein